MINSGELLDGAGLAYPAGTTTLRLEDGAVAIAEGPFRTLAPNLRAYYLVSCRALAAGAGLGLAAAFSR